MSLGTAPVDDDLLHALLSFAALSVRAPVVGFLTEMAAGLDQRKRENLVELLVRLVRVIHEQRTARSYSGYEPRPLPIPARHAAYSANLVLLSVCVSGGIKASELYGTQADVITSWHKHALLWRSQLSTEEWTSLVETLALDRLSESGRRDIRLTLGNDAVHSQDIDPYWTFGNPVVGERKLLLLSLDPDALRRKMHFLCGINDDVVLYALEPLTRTSRFSISAFVGGGNEKFLSPAHALLDVWLLPLRDPTAEERRAVYERCIKIAKNKFFQVPKMDQFQYIALLIDRLTTDEKASAALAADVLAELLTSEVMTFYREDITPRIARCVLTFLGRDHDSDRRIAALLRKLEFWQPADIVTLEAYVRLAELGLPVPPLGDLDKWINSRSQPDSVRHLARRIRRLSERNSLEHE